MSPLPVRNANSTPKLKVPSDRLRPKKVGEPLVLPPGVSADTFAEFLERCRSICGHANVTVIEREDQLVDGSYHEPNKTHDMHHILDKTHFVCSATICPREVHEVQEMMRLCNEFDVAVWPFSIGRNTGYGGAAPRVPGSICLNMGKHMNRVLEVNTRDAYALLEPGVTYQDLHDYLVKHNLRDKVWMDVRLSSHGNARSPTNINSLGAGPGRRLRSWQCS